VQELRLPPPPRHVPLSLFIANATGSKIAWLVLAFASVFFWFFAMRADLAFIAFRPPYQEAEASVIGSRKTGASENKVSVYEVRYEYSADGKTFEGKSYNVGSAPDAGEHVTVEYLPGAPQSSRVAGMRRDLWSPWMLLITIFPAGALLVVYFTARNGLRRCRLLRDGFLTTAKCIEQRGTNMRVNNQQVYELVFGFTAIDGRECTTTIRTHQVDRLRDEEEEPLLYDLTDPSRAYLLDSMPSRPKLNEVGELEGRPVAAVFALLFPLFAAAVNWLIFVNR